MDLHPRLLQDCHILAASQTSIWLLHKNATLPWFILVPKTDEQLLYRIEPGLRAQIEQEWAELAAWIHDRYGCAKVNTAAIGNLVPQLHLHCVGRQVGDPCWPGVVWGQDIAHSDWDEDKLEAIRMDCVERWGLATAF